MFLVKERNNAYLDSWEINKASKGFYFISGVRKIIWAELCVLSFAKYPQLFLIQILRDSMGDVIAEYKDLVFNK